MTGDRDKFLTLQKERDGFVSFGNDDSSKIIGKGTVRIGNKNEKVENVLLVEDMKHNLVSVGNTKTTERGGVNQLFISLNNFMPFKTIIKISSCVINQHTAYGQ
jgi:hypothetical protein